jgi:DNA-binding CsgD family transcriptional regulator
MSIQIGRASSAGPKTTGHLQAGREAYRNRAWGDAYEALSRADSDSPLSNDDLWHLAITATLVGRDHTTFVMLERLHHAYVEAGEDLPAARAAFWQGLQLLGLGDVGQASGWIGRAEALIGGRDCVEKGYILVPAIHRLVASRDFDGARKLAAQALAIGDRFADADLQGLARSLLGRALVRDGQIAQGVAILDQAMVGAMSDSQSPVVTGIIYCSVIADCQIIYALDRAREWTSVLSNWCAAQPQLAAFSGTCLVHRAEVMQLSGAWSEAIAETERALARLSRTADPEATAAAFYQQAEVHRLRGEFALANEAYRSASQAGGDPQPGLALLRLAEGRVEAAANAIRRALDGAKDPLNRARLLPAYVEITLAAEDGDQARVAAGELREIAARYDTEVLTAMAAHADGAVRLAEGDPSSAVAPLRRSFAAWQRVGAPCLAARIRVLLGFAYQALNDEDGAALEFEAARAVFEGLGAGPDLQRLAMLGGKEAKPPRNLTKRELEVLKQVAAGKTNRAIAVELALSEKTIDRHVSNIFVKLDVRSRTAAAAFAHEHHLV